LILLTLFFKEKWTTHQVDYDNAFSQAELTEAVIAKLKTL